MLLTGVIGVAFLTLLERKVLGLTQLRLGPRKLSFLGLIQPVIDGLKILEKTYLEVKLRALKLVGPALVMFLFIVLWLVIPWLGMLGFLKTVVFLFLIRLRLLSYSVIITR